MHFQTYQDAAGEWRWNLRADNMRIIADSGEGYKERADCLAALELIKTQAAQATIQEPNE